MAYVVLARRWRPQTFEQVVGQHPVTRTLKNALSADRIPHALLFAGPRGVGKTTTARILAKALNCEKGASPDPCGVCGSCEEITTGRSLDCLEIDGASNRGIDEVRELRENVRYAPSRGRYRVVIIDEVHMLTEPAFNALLKTLEEPPPRVVFILATTELHKIPATILSRCQRHDFRRIEVTEIVGRLSEIVTAEGMAAEDDALALLARAAEGSLRDAQSLLDQVVAFSGEKITVRDVTEVLGLIEGEAITGAVSALAARDGAKLLLLVEELTRRGRDLRLFVQEILHYLRDLLVVKIAGEAGALVQGSRVDPTTRASLAAAFTLPEVEAIFQILSRAEEQMRRSSHPRYILEMAFARACEVKALQSLETLLQKVSGLGQSLLAGRAPEVDRGGSAELPLFSAVPAAPSPEGLSPQASSPSPESPRLSRGSSPVASAAELAPRAESPRGRGVVEERWEKIRERVGQKKRVVASLLPGPDGLRWEGNTLIITVTEGSTFARSTLDDPAYRSLLLQSVAEVAGESVPLDVRYGSPEGTASRRVGGGPAPRPAVSRPSPDPPLVRQAVDLFQGRIIEGPGGGDPPF